MLSHVNRADHVGIDLGDRFSYCCLLGPDGKILTEGRLRSTPVTLARHFQDLPPSCIVIEVGTHSRWVSQLLGQWGHEVIVANPRNLRMIADSIRKSDQSTRTCLDSRVSIRNCSLRSCPKERVGPLPLQVMSVCPTFVGENTTPSVEDVPDSCW